MSSSSFARSLLSPWLISCVSVRIRPRHSAHVCGRLKTLPPLLLTRTVLSDQDPACACQGYRRRKTRNFIKQPNKVQKQKWTYNQIGSKQNLKRGNLFLISIKLIKEMLCLCTSMSAAKIRQQRDQFNVLALDGKMYPEVVNSQQKTEKNTSKMLVQRVYRIMQGL